MGKKWVGVRRTTPERLAEMDAEIDAEIAAQNRRDFKICYADPPWLYDDKAQAGNRGAESKFQCMRAVDIAELPVREFMADNAVLLMWATFPMMSAALYVIEAWGFEYKTCELLWVKTSKFGKPLYGMGHGARANAEPLLRATRGKGVKRLNADVSQIVMAQHPGEHSAKPAVIRDRIVQLYGNRDRIELFSRHSTPGWSHHGLEAPRDGRFFDAWDLPEVDDA